MPGVYLAAILFSSVGMLVIDRRWRLYLFADVRHALTVQVSGIALFLAWDVLCIRLGIFMRGPGPWQTGWQVAPELPVEEIFFLWFLCHFSMVVFTGLERLLAHLAGPRDDGHSASGEAGP
ncbi:lycopene cyclase domain-containing protein [Kytococcus sp. Marseille-QA3725]